MQASHVFTQLVNRVYTHVGSSYAFAAGTINGQILIWPLVTVLDPNLASRASFG